MEGGETHPDCGDLSVLVSLSCRWEFFLLPPAVQSARDEAHR